ncbi:MAG: heavy-metal-associated domain-containing protein [Vicingaceae bacterium]|nr:heavy-metal-associated domain-containing protein [Flavobacteriales bacterium]MDF1676461.1 heavy-metal-associated domain-containing protein [Vicingaceae bacterium]
MKKQILKVGTVAVMLFSVLTVQSVIGQETSTTITQEEQEELVNATFTVYGNCGMCKKRIEKAALSVDGVKEANWDVETKVLSVKFSDITFGENNYSINTVSEKIAAVGHDTQFNKASKDDYNALPGCCQYDRPENKTEEHNHNHKH